MTHEPECENLQDTVVLRAECWICDIAEHAYQRGREDAAQAIKQLETDKYGYIWERLAIHAARGSGEQ